jgi:hypothetical protein
MRTSRGVGLLGGVSLGEEGRRGECNGGRGVVGMSCGEERWIGEREEAYCVWFVGIICAEESWRGAITGDGVVVVFEAICCGEDGWMIGRTIGSGGTTLLVKGLVGGLGGGFCGEETETSVSSTTLCSS